MKTVHLICNAHIDPVWLWQREEGIAEAISTFRVAADFCEKYDGFIFNHNEAVLYEWVEEYEPALFKRIQALVKEGKWHIMGGWYLQPDCNMPSGESFIRQINVGRKFFQEKFNVVPKTAINFDSFGHSRGLVQIMKKSGFDSYIFTRPGRWEFDLKSDEFCWVGYDGSEIIGHRAYVSYGSLRGEAAQKVKGYIDSGEVTDNGLLLWGIGNHGGGPSEIDLKDINVLHAEGYDIIHSTPEKYFQNSDITKLPKFFKDLNPRSVSCYTSQVRIKQKHRELEHELYMTEKMVSHASIEGLMEYPTEQFDIALKDLLFAEFHDILPGSAIKPVEEDSLRLMDHGLELLSRLKTKAFIGLTGGQKKAADGEIPIMVYNPHPYKVKGIFECEFQLADQNWNMDEFTDVMVCQGEKHLATQVEKEHCNLNLDWRKHIVFEAELEPSQMNRFDCKLQVIKQRPKRENRFVFDYQDIQVTINEKTGLMDRYVKNGVNCIKENAFKPCVFQTTEDPWGDTARGYYNQIGSFELSQKLRVIEDGKVRTTIEGVFQYHDSKLMIYYKIPKKGGEVEIEVSVHWNEHNKVLKLSIPTVFQASEYIGETAFGICDLPNNGDEAVSQRWCGFKNEILIVNEGSYGSSCKNGEIALTLVNGTVYSALTIDKRPIVPNDRESPHIDQGERKFKFWFDAFVKDVSLRAEIHNQKPYLLSFFPSGQGKKPNELIKISDNSIQMSAFYKEEDNYILRLFESEGMAKEFTLTIPTLGISRNVKIGQFEIASFFIDSENKRIQPIICG